MKSQQNRVGDIKSNGWPILEQKYLELKKEKKKSQCKQLKASFHQMSLKNQTISLT